MNAIQNYTSNGYYEVNAGLRNGTLCHTLTALANDISAELATLPAYTGTTYRAMSTYSENGAAIIAAATQGADITFPEFLSTSTDAKVADRFGMDKKKYNFRFTIIGSTGRNIASASIYRDEAEVLFNKGTRFTATLTKVENDGEYTTHHITLTEVAGKTLKRSASNLRKLAVGDKMTTTQGSAYKYAKAAQNLADKLNAEQAGTYQVVAHNGGYAVERVA